ncbi:MAG: FGGY-family carbohydrate kinase, partial [Candidatus Gallimonas sp.]
GIGEASGMFPVDGAAGSYCERLLDAFDGLVEGERLPFRLRDLLPEVLAAGREAGRLTAAGARFLDRSGNLQEGIPFAPPEGDAGTGMVATNSLRPRTGNVSAGTSVFAMIVLDRPLNGVHAEIDGVVTPVGDEVAMVHCNNCTSDLNAWVELFAEFARLTGSEPKKAELYDLLYFEAEKGDRDCGGLLAYNCVSNEHVTEIEAGRPLFARTPQSAFTLANFMRAHLYSALGALKIGCDILFKEEGVKLDAVTGHGGLFKTERVGQRFLAAALGAPVTVLKTAGEGGAWGMAMLANYVLTNGNEALADYLERTAFSDCERSTLAPDPKDEIGFDAFMRRYIRGLPVVRQAVVSMREEGGD